jgi:hypothetical protein
VWRCGVLPLLLRNTPPPKNQNSFAISERAISERSPRPWVLGGVVTEPKLIEVNNISNHYEKLTQLLCQAIAWVRVKRCDLIGRLSTTLVVPANNQTTTQMRRLTIPTIPSRGST